MAFDIDDAFDLGPDDPVLVIQIYSPSQIGAITDNPNISANEENELMEKFYAQNLLIDPGMANFRGVLNQYADEYALSALGIGDRRVMMAGDLNSLEAVKRVIGPAYYAQIYAYKDFKDAFGDFFDHFGVLEMDIEFSSEEPDEDGEEPPVPTLLN